MKANYALLLMVFVLSACGYHLRGSQGSNPINISNLYIRSIAAGDIGTEVTSQLQLADIKLSPSAKDAEYILKLENETFERTVLSVSATTGKVEEYKLTLGINVSVTTADGKLLVNNENINISRDYTFDEDTILGKSTEEDILRQDLTRQIAAGVIRRLNAAVKSN